MNSTLKTILIWFTAFLFTGVLLVYQRMSGPTYPVRNKVEIDGTVIKYQLLRTSDDAGDQKLAITVADTSVGGEFTFRRFRSYDNWTTVPLKREGNDLVAFIPHQPIAGKVMYTVTLIKGAQKFPLSKEPVILRFKGKVPGAVLIPHIFFIFLAMFFAVITCLEAIFRRKNVYLFTWLTTIFFFISGIILGPLMQEYAFGALWTGWPFGHDLTDNKTLLALIMWIIALVVLRKNREKRVWAIVAFVVMLAVYMIPHSVLGSEVDFTKQAKTETTK
jgi:hypothetical protein